MFVHRVATTVFALLSPIALASHAVAADHLAVIVVLRLP